MRKNFKESAEQIKMPEEMRVRIIQTCIGKMEEIEMSRQLHHSSKNYYHSSPGYFIFQDFLSRVMISITSRLYASFMAEASPLLTASSMSIIS